MSTESALLADIAATEERLAGLDAEMIIPALAREGVRTWLEHQLRTARERLARERAHRAPSNTPEHVTPERWVGRQLQEILALACTAEASAALDAERRALVVAHAFAHGPHQRGKCDTCDAGRAWLEAWLLGRADAPRELTELRRIAAMGAAAYQEHWRAHATCLEKKASPAGDGF